MPGRWWLHIQLEGGQTFDGLKLGIFCDHSGARHVISLDVSRQDCLVTIVGGPSRFELQASAFPKQVMFKALRFSKITPLTAVAYAANRLKARLLPESISSARAASAQPPQSLLAQPTEPSLVDALGSQWLTLKDEIRAFVPPGQSILPQSLELAHDYLSKFPNLQAVYGDLAFDDAVWPQPAWDATLAEHFNYVEGAIFMRDTGVVPSATQSTGILQEIATRYGDAAIARIPLPLSRTQAPAKKSLPLIRVPERPNWPKVSVVIPTKVRLDLLAKCLDGLAHTTDYEHALEVVLVDNGADPAELGKVIEAYTDKLLINLIERHGPFNYSWLVNQGVQASNGEILVLLNDDVAPLSPCWMKRIVSSALLEDVGAVGAQLRNQNGSIQHAGVALGLAGLCGHMWRGLTLDQAIGYPSIHAPSQRSAVTGACLAVKRSLFLAIGMFDEEALPVTLNDIDFCLRLNQAGYKTIYRGDALLTHQESSSRGADIDRDKAKRRHLEIERFLKRWPIEQLEDPWFSPAFDRFSESGFPPNKAAD